MANCVECCHGDNGLLIGSQTLDRFESNFVVAAFLAECLLSFICVPRMFASNIHFSSCSWIPLNLESETSMLLRTSGPRFHT